MSRSSCKNTGIVAALCAVVLAFAPLPAQATGMPVGGTSWMEVFGNSVVAPGNASAIPYGQYAVAPYTGTAFLEGTVNPTTISVSAQAAGPNGGAVGVWGATGGNFTLHGAGVTPLNVTAYFDYSGSLDLGHTTTLAAVNVKIGAWRFNPVASEVNQRVATLIGAPNTTGGSGCVYNGCAAGPHPFSGQLHHQVSVAPEASFNLGFFLFVYGDGLLGFANSHAVGEISFDLPEGYYLTGDNGFDSRSAATEPVPEPASLGLLGFGLASLRFARRSRSPLVPQQL